MGEGEDDSGSLDSDSDLILDGENAAGVGAGMFISYLSCLCCCVKDGIVELHCFTLYNMYVNWL